MPGSVIGGAMSQFPTPIPSVHTTTTASDTDKEENKGDVCTQARGGTVQFVDCTLQTT